MPHITSGPERIEGGWWDDGDVQRDYYIVRTEQRRRICGSSRISATGSWYLHGFWS